MDEKEEEKKTIQCIHCLVRRWCPDVQRLHTWTQTHRKHNRRGREDCQDLTPSPGSFISTFSIRPNAPLCEARCCTLLADGHDHRLSPGGLHWVVEQPTASETAYVHSCGTYFPLYGLQMETLLVWKSFGAPVILMTAACFPFFFFLR